MFKHILLPLDGSPLAEQSIPLAAQFARAGGGAITLTRTVRATAEFELSLAPPAAWAPAADAGERARAVAYLERLRSQEPLADLPVRVAVYAGPPAAMTLAAAASSHADLIVMMSHGRTGVSRWLLGSVAAEVAREAAIPVYILRTPAGGPNLSEPTTMSALVALDGSARAEAAVAPALQLLASFSDLAHLELRLLSVVTPLPLTTAAPFAAGVAGEGEQVLTDVDRAMVSEAEEYLCAAAERAHHAARELAPGRAVKITWNAIWSPDVAHTIIASAEPGERSDEQETEEPASDFIAIATHGRGGVRRWVMGSIADRVLHATHLPVLIVRPRSAAQPDVND